MFYVANGKVYLSERDSASGVYREVKIVNGVPIAQNRGVAQKPVGRSLCNLSEVVAQFGNNYPIRKSR